MEFFYSSGCKKIFVIIEFMESKVAVINIVEEQAIGWFSADVRKVSSVVSIRSARVQNTA